MYTSEDEAVMQWRNRFASVVRPASSELSVRIKTTNEGRLTPADGRNCSMTAYTHPGIIRISTMGRVADQFDQLTRDIQQKS